MTDIFGWLYALDDTEFNCPPNSGDMDIKTGFLKNEDGISYVLEPREQTEVYTVVMHCTGTGQGGIHIIPYGNDACGNEIAGKSYITRWQQVFSVSCNATVTKVGHNTTFTAIVGEDAAPPWVWEWDFGDGATASGGPTSNPVIVTNHAYAAANVSPGWYACIEVTDDNGITVECCSYATVYDELTASCNVSANSTGAGETVTFTGTASGGFPECPAPNCCNYFWEWDFGDGSSVSGPGYGPIVVNHAYNICGTFIAVFTIQDDCLNNTASCNATVEVVPGITCYDYETTVCQAVNFTADITCDFPGASWFWDFGDGTNSTAQSPSHAYMCTGTYNYTVEVCDEFDNCVNCTGTVEVTIKPPQLISPPNGSEPTNKEVTFEWEDIGCCDYTLFVYQKDSDVKIWMVQTGKVNHWTGIVFNGEWRWFVVAKDACNETVTSDQWLFDMDQKAPAVVVNSPNGGETLTCNSTWAITWYADPAEGSINIDYSSDGGATWKPVATGEVNDGAYPWKVPCINSDLCLVKVSVYDAATGWAHDTSDGVFSITTAPAPTSSIELGTGWNLISLPLIPTTYNITTILADISGNVTIVWYYDAATAGWLRYVPGSLSNTLTTMEDGKGYFVFMAAPESLTVTGQEMPTPPATPPTYNVYAGWNLIGFKSTTPMNHALYLLSMAGKYIVLWGYDNATGYFSVYPLGAHGGNMEPGHGYWLWATADGLIVPP
jgi:PKD repeat protein